MAPRVLGTAIVQINFVVSNSLASQMGTGAVSAINYAWMLMLIPQGVFAQAVGTAAFPTFASQVAQGRYAKMRDTLSSTLRAIFFLSLPATMGMIVLGQPLIALLFERGAFKSGSTEAVTWALSFYALGLIGHAGLEVVARAFYALHDTLTPVWVGAVAVAVNIALSLALPGAFKVLGWPPYAGLALAMSVATLLNLVLLLLLMRRRMAGLQDRRLLITVFKGVLATLIMGLALLGWQAMLAEAGALTVGLSGVVLGVIVYVGAALLLRAQVLQSMVRMVRN
jgi:putative peptidoglycan lipid II flippase